MTEVKPVSDQVFDGRRPYNLKDPETGEYGITWVTPEEIEQYKHWINTGELPN